MLDINYYNIYSILSANENKNEVEFEKNLMDIEKFEEIKNYSAAKAYLEEIWKINKNVSDYRIGNDCILNFQENKMFLSINFIYKDQNITYFYNK